MDKRTDKRAGMQTVRQTERKTETQNTKTYRCIETNIYTDTWMNRHMDIHTNR
jgi:hypothetical protein